MCDKAFKCHVEVSDGVLLNGVVAITCSYLVKNVLMYDIETGYPSKR